jgi:hypothetical protein
MKTKLALEPGNQVHEELLKHTDTWASGQLEILDSWAAASEIEMARWTRAGDAVKARVGGATHDLVEQLLADRAVDHQVGVYFTPGAADEELIYATRRLQGAGQKVVLVDWDLRTDDLEALLAAELEVVSLVRDQVSSQGWTVTVEGAADLMAQLEGVDVIIYRAEQGDLGVEMDIETWAMASSKVGGLAGAWGASVLAAGELRNSSTETWSKNLQVLVGQMALEMTT